MNNSSTTYLKKKKNHNYTTWQVMISLSYVLITFFFPKILRSHKIPQLWPHLSM